MDNFKSQVNRDLVVVKYFQFWGLVTGCNSLIIACNLQIVHVVNTVDKLAPTDRIEALSYLQKITEAFKNKSLPSGKFFIIIFNIDLLLKYA